MTRRRPRRPSRAGSLINDTSGSTISPAALPAAVSALQAACPREAAGDPTSPVPLLLQLRSAGAFRDKSVRVCAARVAALTPPDISQLDLFLPAVTAIVSAATAEAPVDAQSLLLSFRAICLWVDCAQQGKRNGERARDSGATEETALRNAIELAVPCFAEAVRCVLFPSPGQGRPSWRGASSGEDLSESALSSSALSGADSDMGCHNRRSDLSLSQPLSPHASNTLHFRRQAIGALSAIATVSPLALIPYWSFFLPDRDGVASVRRGPTGRRETLANLMLYERNEAVRGAAVSLVTSLLMDSWRFARGGPVPNQGDPAHTTRRDGSASPSQKRREARPPAFTSVGGRVVRTCSALYSVVASAIRKEASPGVLARLTRLATELCANAPAPAVALEHVEDLISALLVRSVDVHRTDHTSRSAALSCIASALSRNCQMIRKRPGCVDLAKLLDACIHALDVPNGPIAEALSVVKALAGCDEILVWQEWEKIAPCLRAFIRANDDQVLRLHVLRALQAMLACLLSDENKNDEARAFVATSVLLREEEVWRSFVQPALSDPFHAVRLCGARCAEQLLGLSEGSKYASEIVANLSSKLSLTGELEKASAVWMAAAKALSATPFSAANPAVWESALAGVVASIREDRALYDRLGKGLHACSVLLDKCTPEPVSVVDGQQESCLSEVLTQLFEETQASLLIPDHVVAMAGKPFDAEALHASSLWALGSCASAILRGLPFRCDVRCGSTGAEIAAEVVETFQVAISRVAGGQPRVRSGGGVGPDRVRVNACKVLGRLCAEIWAGNGPQVTYSNYQMWFSKACDALRKAVVTSECIRVKAVAIGALSSMIDASAVVLDGQRFVDLLHTPLAVLGNTELAHNISHVSPAKPVPGCSLAEDLMAASAGLLCSILRVLGEKGIDHFETDLEFENWNLVLNILLQKASLPAFALRALVPWDGKNADEYRAAVDAWRSLHPSARMEFLGAARLVRHSSANCDASEKLLAIAEHLKLCAVMKYNDPPSRLT